MRVQAELRTDGSCVISKKIGSSNGKEWRKLSVKLEDERWASVFLSKKSQCKSYPSSLGAIGDKQNSSKSFDRVKLYALKDGTIYVYENEKGFLTIDLDRLELEHEFEFAKKMLENEFKLYEKLGWANGKEEFSKNYIQYIVDEDRAVVEENNGEWDEYEENRSIKSAEKHIDYNWEKASEYMKKGLTILIKELQAKLGND